MTNVVSAENPSTEDKKKVRPYYSELQGYLSKAPDGNNSVFYRKEPEWQQVNATIDLLNTATGKSYDRFKLSLLNGANGYDFIRLTAYKQKLAGDA